MSDYVKKYVTVTEKEIATQMERFKDHPRFAKLTDKQKKQQVRALLENREQSRLFEALIDDAVRKKICYFISSPKRTSLRC